MKLWLVAVLLVLSACHQRRDDMNTVMADMAKCGIDDCGKGMK